MVYLWLLLYFHPASYFVISSVSELSYDISGRLRRVCFYNFHKSDVANLLSLCHHQPENKFLLFDANHTRYHSNTYRQEQMRSQIVRSEGKEFAFIKMMTCGLCGSGISADEKFKKQKNGNIHRYVYYGCTKARDKNCKCGYLEEKDLIKQFEELIEKIDLNEIEIMGKMKEEMERFKKFQQVLLGKREKIKIENINIRNYAKYILREGKDVEKRELLGCLKSDILLKNKVISLSLRK